MTGQSPVKWSDLMNLPKTTQVSVKEEVISSLPKSRVRDRIMRTASDLFYRHGIHAVGVDTIASEAGTNKMSFYRNFASKDELVAEYLRSEEREGMLWWDETIAAHAGNPRLQVESLFDMLVENNCEEDSRGCALANAAVEITEADHPARPVIEKYKADMRRRFQQLARDMKAREPESLGDSLMLLWEGAYVARVTMGQHGPVQGAAKAARALIAAYTD
jgi:AcrR family transcriptional regulator